MVIEIAGRRIGAGNPCFVIAEAGVNHNGDRALAHALVDAAADAGADAVKFQTWVTEKICKPGAPKADYQIAQTGADDDQFTMLKSLELPYAWHAELKEHADRRAILFLSTPDEIDSARFLRDLGVAAIKVGSAELTNLPFLRALARLGKPMIVSTGMGTLAEVGEALAAIREVAAVPVSLLHCLSAYPAPEEEMNLRAIVTMREAFGVPVGLSDHTTSAMAATIAVALGGSIVEKHLTIDRHLPGPDHAASADPEEFRAFVLAIRQAERMLGTGVKQPAPSEMNTRATVRRTLLYGASLPALHVVGEDDLVALRCGIAGLQPSAMTQFIGKTIRRAVSEGSPVSPADFE